jgi:hypothetical protein
MIPPMSSVAPATATQPAGALASIRQFLTSIGLEVREVELPAPSFLPGLLIDQGVLLLDPARLLYPGDVLHEAGHLAVAPAADRPALGGDVAQSQPERAGDELAVMLWTYAACRHLGLPPEIVFHPDGYHGQSEWILDNYRQGIYIGLPLLVWMGLTTTDTFPHMTRWLRE